MPARQPITLNQRHFSSHNRARLHYVGILHRYEPGQVLTEPDRADVHALMLHPSWVSSKDVNFDEIRVINTSFRRTCFSAKRADQSSQALSIIAALRRPASAGAADSDVSLQNEAGKPDLKGSLAAQPTPPRSKPGAVKPKAQTKKTHPNQAISPSADEAGRSAHR